MSLVPFATAVDPAGILTVSGDIDDSATTGLRDALESATGGFSRSLTVDLSQVAFLPSSAVGVLALATEKASGAGIELDLVAAAGTIAERVLTVTALPHRTSR